MGYSSKGAITMGRISRRFIMLLAASLMALSFAASTALAKNQDIWADSGYSFSSVKSLYFEDVVFDLSADCDDDILEKKMSDFLRTTAAKTDLRIVPKGESHPTGLVIKTKVENWSSSSQYHPPYTTWETRSETYHWYDRNGNRHSDVRTFQVPVEHPGYTSYFSTVKVRYDGYTPEGKLVYSHREERTKEEANDHYKMFERISKEFLSKLVKQIKK